MRLLPGVDAHVALEVVAAAAGPATHRTPKLSPLLTHLALTHPAPHRLTHQQPACLFQLQRNSLCQSSLWLNSFLNSSTINRGSLRCLNIIALHAQSFPLYRSIMYIHTSHSIQEQQYQCQFRLQNLWCQTAS